MTGCCSIISGEEKKIKRGQKNHKSEKTTQGCRARDDRAVEEGGREGRRDGKRGKWQGVRLLKFHSDSETYIEAFVKMPYRPEQEANYKSHMRTYIYT